jgi:hypothetical protein
MDPNTHSLNAEITDADIEREAARLIAVACQKHNLTPAQLPPGVADNARQSARESLTLEAARRSNPMYGENELLRQKLSNIEAQLLASKTATATMASATSGTTQPVGSVEVARAKLGEYQWNHVLTPDTRLQAIGVAPDSVTPAVRQEIEEVFGRNSTSARATEMFRADPARYRRLREIGRCLRMI